MIFNVDNHGVNSRVDINPEGVVSWVTGGGQAPRLKKGPLCDIYCTIFNRLEGQSFDRIRCSQLLDQ